MKKVIVLGVVLAMALGLSVAANAEFVKDTDWSINMQIGNNTWAATPPPGNWGASAAAISIGNASTPSAVNGSAYTSTTATIRDLSAVGGGSGLTTNLKAALDQTDAVQTQVWDNLKLWVGSGYTSTTLSLKIWTIGVSANGPNLKLEVTQALAGSGFEVGQVIFDTASTVFAADTSKRYPWTTINLYPNLSVLKTGTSADNPAVTFRLVATTPASGPVVITPEPGSMLAMFSGLVGLVGFGIRRRK